MSKWPRSVSVAAVILALLPAAAAAQSAGDEQYSAAQLPRTGADARLPALLGLALLSAGVALRAHARRAS